MKPALRLRFTYALLISVIALGCGDTATEGDDDDDVAAIDATAVGAPDAPPTGTPDAAASTPDAAPTLDAPAGACINAADIAIPTMTIDTSANTCGCTGCTPIPTKECVSTCMTDDIGLSKACADCYGGIVACVVAECALPCLTFDPECPESDDCVACRVENCSPAFTACSGLDG